MIPKGNIKLSVCIPVYGVEKYIERCARSLFEQTMKDGIEFIFVNDSTKDKSIEILEQVLSEYPERKEQVKIIHHEENGGLVAARKTGLAYTTGDYIIHCDSDDWVDSRMYEIMYQKAIETDSDMVYCDFFLAGDSSLKKCQQTWCESPSEMIGCILSGDCHGSLWNKLYKKQIALQKFYVPDDIIMTEDVLRNVQMLLKTVKISYVPQALYFYYFSQTSITNTRNRKCFDDEKKVVDFIEKNILPVYNCASALNVYKRRVLADAVRFRSVDAKEFHQLYAEAKRELFTCVLLHDPLARRILLMLSCYCLSLAYYLLQMVLKIRRCFYENT